MAAKFKIDLEALKKQLSKEIAVVQILENLGLPKEAKPYVFNAISRLQKAGTNVVKVKPGVYKIGNGKNEEKKAEVKVEKKAKKTVVKEEKKVEKVEEKVAEEKKAEEQPKA